MNPKEFYKTYIADDNISPLWTQLCIEILNLYPVHVFEFGCGTGKHLKRLERYNVEGSGIDISPLNVAKAIFGHGLKNVSVGDESYLRHHCNYDCVFTVSVLDHIEDIEGIIGEFKRMSNKAVFLAETTEVVGEFYYKHNFEKYGFKKLDYSWKGDDGATYGIWQWIK